MRTSAQRDNAYLSSRRWQRVRMGILIRDQWVCWLCGRRGADSVDHVVPTRAGGSRWDPANLKAAHLTCNSGKGTRVKTPVVTTEQW